MLSRTHTHSVYLTFVFIPPFRFRFHIFFSPDFGNFQPPSVDSRLYIRRIITLNEWKCVQRIFERNRFSLQYILWLIWMLNRWLHTFNIRKRVYDEWVCMDRNVSMEDRKLAYKLVGRLLFSHGSSVKIDEIWNLNFDCTKVDLSRCYTHDDNIDDDDDLLGAARIHFRKVAVTSLIWTASLSKHMHHF